MQKISKENIISAVQKEFGNDQIIAMYVFGSYIINQMNEESDLDLGVIFQKVPSLFELSGKKSNIEESLDVPVDIVIMNNASPIILYQVLKTGKLIINNDNHSLSLFIINNIE